jgi:hypothetical protein
MDATNTETMLYSDARPKQVIFLPACAIVPTSISNAVELRGPHIDGILTFKFANSREVNILLDIFEKSTTFFGAAQDAFKEVKYVAAGGNAADIRKKDVVNDSDIHGVGLILGLSRNGKSIAVRDIIPGSPAALCDSAIRIHDHLLKVDDVDLKHSCSNLEDVAKLIRGIRGTSVRLVLRRSRDFQHADQKGACEKSPTGNIQVPTFNSPIFMHAKEKYEVVLKRQPPVELFSAERESESKTYEEVENDSTTLLKGESKSLGSTDEAVREGNADENVIAPRVENDATALLREEITSLGSMDGVIRQANADESELAPSQQQLGINLLKEKFDSLELKTQSSAASIPDLGTGQHDGVISFHRSLHLANQQSRKQKGPYARCLHAAGEVQGHARLTNTDVLESGFLPLSSRAKKMENREASEQNVMIFLADIGINVCADDGRYVVSSVHPNAPTAVRSGVCMRDELMSIGGVDVRGVPANDVRAMLKCLSAFFEFFSFYLI